MGPGSENRTRFFDFLGVEVVDEPGVSRPVLSSDSSRRDTATLRGPRLLRRVRLTAMDRCKSSCIANRGRKCRPVLKLN